MNTAKINHTYSIETRLTFFYSLATVVLLATTILFLYFTTLHILHKANQQFLTDEINVIKTILENQPQNLNALKEEVIEVPYTETGSEYRYYIRILGKNKHTIMQTPRFDKTLGDVDFFNHPPADENTARWNSATNHYVLMQENATLGKTDQTVLVQLALDITYQQNIISKYTYLLIFTLIAMTLAAIFIGFIVANRAMRSLHRLTESTKEMTVSSLHKRIDPQSWPKELYHLGMAFNDMLERIETSFLRLTQFSGDLAHELRTPINNLMGEAEIALSRPHSAAEYRRVLESHLEELQRVSQIFENILFLARTENPKLDIKKEMLDMNNEVNLISEFYQAMADEKNIRVTCTGHATIMANAVMIRRMLSNLLSNALKYTPDGGRVHFQINNFAQEMEIILTDNGIGITAENLPKLFHRFYRVDSARARSAGGIGLGLPIVKSIVELHHGTIVVTSELDKGTTIKITLPKYNG